MAKKITTLTELIEDLRDSNGLAKSSYGIETTLTEALETPLRINEVSAEKLAELIDINGMREFLDNLEAQVS